MAAWKIETRYDGTWQIVDDQGRQRAVGQGIKVALRHLAFALADRSFPSCAALDHALMRAALEFPKGQFVESKELDDLTPPPA